MGPGACLSLTRFTVGLAFRTSLIINFVQKERPPSSPGRGTCHASHHPFHCWRRIPVFNLRTVSERKAGILKSDEKTLEWSTILDGIAKMDGFDNPVFILGVCFSSRDVPLSATFNHFCSKQAARSRGPESVEHTGRGGL